MANLGNAYDSLGDVKQAIVYHNQHLSIAKELGDRAGEGKAYGNLGNAYRSLGDVKQAIVYHNQDLSIAKELGDPIGQAKACYCIGVVHEFLDSLMKALNYYRLSIHYLKKQGVFFSQRMHGKLAFVTKWVCVHCSVDSTLKEWRG